MKFQTMNYPMISLLVLFASLSTAQGADTDESTALTIYSTARPGAIPPEMYLPGRQGQYSRLQIGQMVPGFAIVKQERPIELTGPRSVLRFTDVASQIDPTTVLFQSLTDPTGTHVIEQNYEFDLVSSAKLMERYLDKTITVDQVQGDKVATFTGKLLSTQGGLILQADDGRVRVVNGYSNVRFPELPGGLPGLSSGVERELQHAFEHTKEVYIVWKPKMTPSPFITETATKIFSTVDEALTFFQEKGMVMQRSLFGN